MPSNYLLVAPVFPPNNSSASVQLWHLANEFKNNALSITVIVPDHKLHSSYLIQNINNLKIVRLRVPKSIDTSYIRRTISELITPFSMILNYRKSPLNKKKWDFIVWYSPMIFTSIFVNFLKKKNNSKTYLILRDIFPEWAHNLGIINNNLVLNFFKYIENYQNSVADIIGVQSNVDLNFFKLNKFVAHKTELLNNWLSLEKKSKCSINLSLSPLKNKKILVYSGNMGVAQNLSFLLDVAKKIKSHKDIGFLFIGRGSQKKELEMKAKKYDLQNVLFINEISFTELSGIYRQCKVGIISLDKSHKTSNIPGKFLSYISHGLPVLSYVNSSNDLIDIIRKGDVGAVTDDFSIDNCVTVLLNLLDALERKKYKVKCLKLYNQMFTSKKALEQILSSLGKL